MAQGKGKDVPNQPGKDRGLDETIKGRTAADHLDDYATHEGDPDVKVKQFQDQTEFIDNRGPLGTGV